MAIAAVYENQIGARPWFAVTLEWRLRVPLDPQLPGRTRSDRGWEREWRRTTARWSLACWRCRPELFPGVRFVGRNVFRHENWRAVIPAADPGWHEAPLGGIGVVPAFAVAN